MLRRNLWKLILSFAIVLWAVFTTLPLKDRDFGQYIRSESSAKEADLAKLITRAEERVKAGRATSVYVGLKQIAFEEQIDLTQFFPHVRLESTLKNVNKRNEILLAHLSKEAKSPLQLGLDLKGGVAVTLEAPPKPAGQGNDYERQQQLSKAIEIIGNRINSMGVVEPIIRPVGDNRIEIQLPGLNVRENPDVIDSVKKPAQLAFRIVMENTSAMVEPPQSVPPGYEVLSIDEDDRQTGRSYTAYYLVKRIPEMTGNTVSSAQATVDQFGGYQVHLSFNPEGSDKFAAVTTENKGRMLGIVLDGKLYSAPRINDAITGGSAQITGHFTAREAEQLANVLNNPLDLPLEVKEQLEVGPSLAEDAISSGVKSSIIGAVLVAAFMITFYSTGGFVAVIMLAVNIIIIMGTMASLGATLTLPGLAGIVLTIGMAVDANILIFERMREEIAAGKSFVTSNQSGFLKALTTILDAHLVQLLICAVMIWLGTGPIKGFGVTLAIGVISTLFSVLITGHMLMDMLVESGWIKKITMRRMISDVHVDWVKYGKLSFIGGWIIVAIGLGVVIYKGDGIYGIDFAGGDMVTITFKDKIDTGKIREVATAAGIGEVNPTYVQALGGGQQQLKVETGYGKSDALFDALVKAYPNSGLVKGGKTQIGATIGSEIKWNAILSIGVSMLIILVYIAFRFEFGFGIGAMFSSLHDILMTIGLFVIFGHHFSAPMVAAILAIAGYSINETVVVFDRIREELKLNPTGSLREVVNNAISKVFARTIMTSTTTLLAAGSLYVFGGGVLKEISFMFLVGIVTSTFSAIFISSQVFYWWHKGERKHVEAHQDVAPKYEWTGSSRASE
ncbi:protein translocase subunit SecD [Oleiharenicola lentus]|uniref:protein translocase subunit SecD n=1 Tax=Oleiharenicola lentus TaxID=2508720 RepID=UPI003F67BBB0